MAGYNVKNNSIGPEKLTDEVTKGLVEQSVAIMPQYSDPNAKRAAANVYDGLDSSSTTDALSAKQGKVLKDTITTEEKSTGITGVTAYKAGNVVTILLNKSLTATSAGWVSIGGTLPSILRPKANFYCVMIDDTQLKAVEVSINASGTINVYFDTTRTSTIRGSVTFCN